jgi:hypothetical protein
MRKKSNISHLTNNICSHGCPSHRSFIPIQRSKNQNSKTEIPWIANPFSSIFIYKKRDGDKERKKKERRDQIEKKLKSGHLNFKWPQLLIENSD